MSEYPLITPIANQILTKHDLCDQCLGRLFSKKLHLSSNKLLGKKLNKKQENHKCYICKNLFDNLNYFLKLMLSSSLKISFSTFSVGTILKPSIIDRDDLIRSKYKLRGIDSIKTDITKELSKSFSKKTKKSVDPLNSDVTFTVNIKDESCHLRSKSLFLSGRYVKNKRNFSQKQTSCSNCAGKGCRDCNFHGIIKYDSIEGFISKLLFEKIGGTSAKFTWIGGEDKSSLVLGSGRPFFVKLQNPFKRSIKPILAKNDFAEIKCLKIISKFPPQPIKFSSKIDILVSTDSKLTLPMLRKMKILTLNPIVIYEKSGKRAEKTISSISFKKLSAHKFSLKIDAEGGLSIKRFVNGDDVVPSIASILEARCNADEFDFLDVKINDNN